MSEGRRVPPVRDLVALAAGLSAQELESLIVRLQALRPGAKKELPLAQVNAPENWYHSFEEMQQSLRGVVMTPFIAFKKKNRGYPTFAEAAMGAEQFILTLEKDKMKLVAVRRHSAELILRHLAKRGMSLEWGGLSWGMSNLPDLIDQSYPGYLVSGLMGTVLEALYKGIKPRLQLK